MDRLGQEQGPRARLQSDVFRPPAGSQWPHFEPPRRRHPAVLDRPRHRLPPDRRRDGPGARFRLRHKRLDSRRHRKTCPSTGERRANGSANRSTRIFAEKLDPRHNLDAVESKLFGIGSESYVVGSHEFYLGYAIKHGVLLCLDSGHFHPTESVPTKSPPC